MNATTALEVIKAKATEASRKTSKRLDKSKRNVRTWLEEDRNQIKVLIVLATAIIIGLFLFVAQFKVEADNRAQELQQQIEAREEALQERHESFKELHNEKVETETRLKEQKAENEALRKANEQLEEDLQAKKAREAALARKQAERQVTQASYAVGCDNYRGLVSQYDWDTNTMMRIMAAESDCDPTNHNWADSHRTCKGSFGLLQVGCVHGYGSDYLSNPANNVAVAYDIWQSSGYGAWSTY